MPPPTSWVEVTFLFGTMIAVGTIRWSIGFAFSNKLPDLGPSNSWDSLGLTEEELDQVVTAHNRSVLSLLLCIVPFIGFWLGGTSTSLLRDQGYIIFPWIVLQGPLFYYLLLIACKRIRRYSLRSRIQRKAKEIASSATTESATTVTHLPQFDSNPYSSPQVDFETQANDPKN